jgi:Putative beta-barrel porin 2
MDRALGNVANAMPDAGTRGIISSFEAVQTVGDHDGKDQPRASLICVSACVPKQRVGMRRSGALTLGAVLMLGGVTGGRGQELSGAVTSSGPSFPSLDDVVLPTLPENWSDLPVRLTASQSVAYNSNIFVVPLGFALPAGAARSDFSSTSLFGLSTKPYWYGQQFFFDASFGEIRYLHQFDFNSDTYNVDAGVNWTLTSRCSGALTALASKSPTTVNTQVVTTTQIGLGVNNLTTTSFNETGNCAFGNGYSAIFNSGKTQSSNSNPIDALNNYRSTMVAAGVEYTNSLSNLTALATITDTDYSDRNEAIAPGLLSTFVEHDISLTYVRTIDPNLTLTGQFGLTGAGTEFTLALPKTLLPHYSAMIAWAITPKLSLTASAAKAISPPTTLISNAQLEYNTQFKLSYQATPKIVVAASASAGYTSTVFSQALTGTLFAPLQGSQDIYTAQASLTYTMTPFLVAALTASYYETVQNHLITPQDLITVSLNYKPY